MPTRNPQQILHRVVGNREPIGLVLLDIDGQPASDLAGKTFTARLVAIPSGAVETNGGPVTLVDSASGEVSWTPAAADVDTAGRYAVYIVDNSAIPRRWPYDGAQFQLHVFAEHLSQP